MQKKGSKLESFHKQEIKIIFKKIKLKIILSWKLTHKIILNSIARRYQSKTPKH